MSFLTLVNASTPYLIESVAAGRSASIIVISSLAGFEAKHHAIAGPYTTLKRSQAVLAKDFGRKLAPLGIRINTVVPGTIETPGYIKEDGQFEDSKFRKFMNANPEVFKKYMDEVGLRRPGTVEEVANTVVFLGSKLSGYICGSEIYVDGGMSISL